MKQKDISEHEFDTSKYIEMKTLTGELRAENKRLRGALEEIAKQKTNKEAYVSVGGDPLTDYDLGMDYIIGLMRDVAKQALKGTDDE